MRIKDFFNPRKFSMFLENTSFSCLMNVFTIFLKDNYSSSESSEKNFKSSVLYLIFLIYTFFLFLCIYINT